VNGGRTVFLGPPEIAPIYFRTALGFSMSQNENPADVLMDIIGGKVARDNNPSFKPIHLVGQSRPCHVSISDAFKKNKHYKPDYKPSKTDVSYLVLL